MALKANINNKVVISKGVINNTRNTNKRVNRTTISRRRGRTYGYNGYKYLRRCTSTANVIHITREALTTASRRAILHGFAGLSTGGILSTFGRNSGMTYSIVTRMKRVLNKALTVFTYIASPRTVIVNNNISGTKRPLVSYVRGCCRGCTFATYGGAPVVLTALKGSTNVCKSTHVIVGRMWCLEVGFRGVWGVRDPRLAKL